MKKKKKVISAMSSESESEPEDIESGEFIGKRPEPKEIKFKMTNKLVLNQALKSKFD